MKEKSENQNLHKDHRERLRARFLSHPDSLSKHELLELLLFYAIPQKNTNPIAHKLLDRYGNLKNVLNADENDLVSVEGVGLKTASFLKVIGKFDSVISEEGADEVNFYSLNAVKPYLLRVLSKEKYECFCVFYLNEHDKIIKRELCTQNEKFSVKVSFDVIHKTCLLLNPKKVVVAHNHPSGNVEPSFEDDESTKELISLMRFLNVKLCDHVIVGGNDVFSYALTDRFEQLKQGEKK